MSVPRVNPATNADNGNITGYAVQSVAPALTTPPTVDPTGVVSLAAAQPAGNHVITIRATDNCGVGKSNHCANNSGRCIEA